MLCCVCFVVLCVLICGKVLFLCVLYCLRCCVWYGVGVGRLCCARVNVRVGALPCCCLVSCSVGLICLVACCCGVCGCVLWCCVGVVLYWYCIICGLLC